MKRKLNPLVRCRECLGRGKVPTCEVCGRDVNKEIQHLREACFADPCYLNDEEIEENLAKIPSLRWEVASFLGWLFMFFFKKTTIKIWLWLHDRYPQYCAGCQDAGSCRMEEAMSEELEALEK